MSNDDGVGNAANTSNPTRHRTARGHLKAGPAGTRSALGALPHPKEIHMNTETTTARELLIAALLVNAEDDGAIAFDDDRYIDWSIAANHDDPDSGRRFEVADADGDLVQLDLSWAEIERLQRALTLTLINRKS
jgi:hypothetical protein